VFRSW